MPKEPSVTSSVLNGYNKARKLALLGQNRIERGSHLGLRNSSAGRVHKPQFQETTQPPEVTPQSGQGREGIEVDHAWRFIAKGQLPK